MVEAQSLSNSSSEVGVGLLGQEIRTDPFAGTTISYP
jgi:hypothetical protein